MEPIEEDGFQSTTRRKSKLQSKRRNKLSNKHRTKAQKTGDGNNKGDSDLFSPVSCTLSRKKSRIDDEPASIDDEPTRIDDEPARIDDEPGVIILSDDDSNDNLKANGENSEIFKDKQVKPESKRCERNELLSDREEKAIFPVDNIEHFDKDQSDQECEIKEKISSLIRQPEKENQLKTLDEVIATSSRKDVDSPESSQSLKCSTPYSSSSDKNIAPRVSAINSSLSSNLEENFGKLQSDISEFSKKLNFTLSNSLIECERFSESKSNPKIKEGDLEHENEVDSSETPQDSNHSIQGVFPNLLHLQEVDQSSELYQKEIEDHALCPESRIRSFSLEHLNDCTPDDGQGSTSEIKSDEEKREVSSVTHNDSKKLTNSCPLCWKTFESSQSQMVHMKECAAKHNLSTRQLLDALELQEKQSAERLALGLPEIAVSRVVKKPPAKKKTGAGNDTNLQLALALSVSLQEAEEKEQLQEDECLIEAGLGHEVVERQNTMLERFGFTNSRPPLLPSSSSRSKQGSKNKNKNTVLTQRTKEERERLITEKVAIILIGEENNSSPIDSNENTEVVEDSMDKMNSLQKYERKSNSLWSAVTSSSKEEKNHYVRELSNQISPCKVKAGEKIKHLSQVPGRYVTPTKAEVAADDNGLNVTASSQANELGKEAERLVESKSRQNLSGFFPEKEKSNKSLAETLISNWRTMLNRKAFSDVKILVESNKEIYGHRVVFYARCRSILKDIIIEQHPEKSICMLMWTHISYRAALAFLQFIYCGLTSKILRLDVKDMSDVTELAQTYKVTELLEYLKVMNKVRATVNKDSSPNSSKLHERTVTPVKSFSPLQNEHDTHKSYQEENVATSFSQNCSGSFIPLSEEFISLQEDKLSAYSPSKNHCNQDKNECWTPSKKNCMFPNSGRNERCSSLSVSTRSRHISDNDVTFPEQNMNTALDYKQEINRVHSSQTSSKAEINMNSPSLKQSTVRSTSPDLFMEEENEENIQATSAGLSQASGMDLRYLLRMFDICLTQNGQESTSQQKSPTKSKSASPVISQNESSSPILKNKFSSSPQIDESVNNSQELTINKSKSSLQHTPKTKDSTNDRNEVVSSSFSLDTNIEAHTPAEELQFNSEEIRNIKSLNDSKAVKKDFDCIDFLENLISDSPSKKCNKDMESGSKRASEDSKRKYSERDSSSDSYSFSTKKVCRESSENELINKYSGKFEPNQTKLNKSKNGENSIIDTLDLTGNSNESDTSQPYSTQNHEVNTSYVNESCGELKDNHLITMQDDICGKTSLNRVTGSEGEQELLTDTKAKNLDSEMIATTAVGKTSGTKNSHHQDDWDSFDEMCNASEPEIFSQGLNKLLSSQSISSNSEKHKNKSSSTLKSQKKISSPNSVIISPHRTSNHSRQTNNNKCSLEDTLMACLNESILWKDENAPILKSTSKDRKSALLQEHNKYYKTPTQRLKNVNTEDITPPANYSTMKTPELKKELHRYGLKPSLTKKQAKIMLRYIYDQLHPFITISDSEDSADGGDNGLPLSPFKIPDKNTQVPRSPKKKVNNSGTSRSLTQSKRNRHNPVSVRRSLASQIDAGSDCDELSSHESSSSSTIDVAEEMLVEDLEGFDNEISGSQDVCSSDVLPSVVQRYITENPELHQKVLQHEPIWIEEFLSDLKAQNYKFKMNNLMDYFDEQCITFRTVQSQKSRQRKKQRKEARKKNSPAKKKGKRSSSKSAASSTLNSPSSCSN